MKAFEIITARAASDAALLKLLISNTITVLISISITVSDDAVASAAGELEDIPGACNSPTERANHRQSRQFTHRERKSPTKRAVHPMEMAIHRPRGQITDRVGNSPAESASHRRREQFIRWRWQFTDREGKSATEWANPLFSGANYTSI
jgi:hypothetical protein